MTLVGYRDMVWVCLGMGSGKPRPIGNMTRQGMQRMTRGSISIRSEKKGQGEYIPTDEKGQLLTTHMEKSEVLNDFFTSLN